MSEQSTNRPTFLMYDGVGSSKAALALPYGLYRTEMLGRLYALTDRLVTAHDGRECSDPHGDDCLAVFPTATQAIACAVALQVETKSLTVRDAAGTEHTFFIRLVVHTATQHCTPDAKGNFQNHPDIIFAARVLPLACAGQILLTQSAKDAAGNLAYADKSHRNRRLRNFEEKPHTLYELLYDGKDRLVPGTLFLPDWFRETNRYISRPALEEQVGNLFAERTDSDVPYRLVTLHGFGGMGKTRLSRQFALQMTGLFSDRIFMVRLGDITSDKLFADDRLRRDVLFSELLKAFDVPNEPPPTPDDLPALVAQKLAAFQEQGPALLLLDNWETVEGNEAVWLIEAILEENRELRILATGRNLLNSPMERPWDMEGLTDSEGEALLLTRIREKMAREWQPNDADRAAVPELVRLTAAIPLALELVAAHGATGSLPALAADLRKDILGDPVTRPAHIRPDRKTDRHESLQACLNWSWRLLKPEEQTALACLSLFADPCSTAEILACYDFIQRKHLIGLHLASLVRYDNSADTYSLLRPVREYGRRRLKERDEAGEWQEKFISRYVQIAKVNGGPDNGQEKAKRDILEAAWPHAQNAVELAAERADGISAGKIVNGFVYYLYRQARFAETIPVLETSLTAQQAALPDGHPDVAESLNNLAEFYRNQGRYAEAEPLYKQALEIRRAALPAGHPDVADSLNNLALLYNHQGCYLDAEPLYMQALDIYREADGESHPLFATSLNNLAGLYRSQGRYAEAEPLYKQALAIRRKALAEGNLDIAGSLNNLALLYEIQGRYNDAEDLYEQALEIRRAALPDRHPHIAQSLNNLASLYDSQGRYAEAEPLYKQALEIRRAALPAGHPDVADSLNNLAELYKGQGRYLDAEPLYRLALEFRQKGLPPRHPDIAESLNNLAEFYRHRGRYAEAEPLYKQALEMRRKVLPDGHLDIAGSLNNLALLYKSQGRCSEAEPLYKQALDIYRHTHGESHPLFATSLNNLAGLYHSQDRFIEAETLYKQALQISQKVLPEGHRDIAGNLNNLALLYKSQGRYSEAEPLYKQALAIRRAALPGGHRDIAQSVNNLALLYDSQGRFEEAEPLYQQALQIFTAALGEEHPNTKTVAGNYRLFLEAKMQRETGG